MRLLVIGLDCAPPWLVFEHWADDLPNLRRLRDQGCWGPLRSCEPPITVPAWTVMTSGYDAGELGLYGFRNRSDGYELRLATSRDVRVKRVWDRLSEAGRRVAALFVPLTSPPTPVRGSMMSCFLHEDGPVSFPASLAEQMAERFGAYQPDVESFRDGDLDRIFEELHRMGRQHFDIAEHVWLEQQPDFLMMVEMGPDRLHHAAWHHVDPRHPAYVAGNPWESMARDYYTFLDERIGSLMAAAPDAHFMVVSDHGARANEGAFCINEWLASIGWQAWHREPGPGTALRDVVDWSRTRAWGEGGYYSRVFLNVSGREPEGVIDPAQFEAARRELVAKLEKLDAPSARAVIPEEHYRRTRGNPPDLMVYFDDLAWRAAGTVGHRALRLATDDRSNDGCNHDWNGIYILVGPNVQPGRRAASIFDVAPTMLDIFGVASPPLRGRSLLKARAG